APHLPDVLYERVRSGLGSVAEYRNRRLLADALATRPHQLAGFVRSLPSGERGQLRDDMWAFVDRLKFTVRDPIVDLYSKFVAADGDRSRLGVLEVPLRPSV